MKIGTFFYFFTVHSKAMKFKHRGSWHAVTWSCFSPSSEHFALRTFFPVCSASILYFSSTGFLLELGDKERVPCR